MDSANLMALVVFVMLSSGALLVTVFLATRRSRVDARLKSLTSTGSTASVGGGLPATSLRRSQFTHATLPRMGQAIMPRSEKDRTVLTTRLIHAGYYSRQSLAVFLGVKLLFMVGPSLVGFVLGFLGMVPIRIGVLAGVCMGITGMILPSFWLDHARNRRQVQFKRSLPDALDILVVCLEGGLSLPWALKTVSSELATVHPTLATELTLVEREIQLGRSPGEALQQMGIRTDLEEVRSLSTVITQAEKFGASLVKSIRVHGDTLRERRQQRAEEQAQKAGTKILVPTVLFIFPAIFVVILGPAVIQMMDMLKSLDY